MQTVKPRARFIRGVWTVWHPSTSAHGFGIALDDALGRWYRKVLRRQTKPVI